MKILGTIIIVILAVIAVLAIVVYSGAYNVSAATEDDTFVDRVLSRAMTRSVEVHSKKIKPPLLNDDAMIRIGADHYREMCVDCHGAPGVDPSEVGQGLNPAAPDLVRVVPEFSPSQLYWVVKNGIRMTGMPAFGRTHGEAELWAIVAFMEKLPAMSHDEYVQMTSGGTEHGEH